MQNVIIEFKPPTEPLEIIKAFLDLSTAILFVVLFFIILLAAKRFPVLERKTTFYPLILFALLGTISTAMDAFDEWFWFTPGEFYDYIWKPVRLGLFIIAIFILVFAFQQFYRFSERIFGED